MTKLQCPDHNTLCVIYRDLDMRIRRQLVGNPRFGVERIRIVRKQLCFLWTGLRHEKLLQVYQRPQRGG